MLLRMAFALTCLVILNPSAALAWGFEGHRVVGSIADKLLKRDGRMIRAVEAMGAATFAEEGVPFRLDLI